MGPMRVSLYLSLCLMAFSMQAHAQKAPAPSEPPPRVPFTAFRMKPILDPKLQAQQDAVKASGRSIVIQDKDAAAPKSHKKILGTLPVAKPKPQNIIEPPVQLQVQTVRPPVKDLPQNTPLLSEPENRRVPDKQDSGYVSAAISAAGLPIPPSKPVPPVDANAPYHPPVEAPVVTEVAPTPPAQPPLQEMVITAPAPIPQATEIVAPKPMTQDEIASAPTNVRRNRFSSQSRMSGTGTSHLDIGLGSSGSNDLPDELRSIRVGKLEEAEGISPIIIPGLQQAEVPRAPDTANAGGQKLPSEVIVFFQENSDELEVGQLEILDSDVVGLLQNRKDLDIEIVAYADAPDGNRNAAKSLSQARALKIRDYLVRRNIDAGRVEVTAKANDTKIDPRDRADLFFSR